MVSPEMKAKQCNSHNVLFKDQNYRSPSKLPIYAKKPLVSPTPKTQDSEPQSVQANHATHSPSKPASKFSVKSPEPKPRTRKVTFDDFKFLTEDEIKVEIARENQKITKKPVSNKRP
jgi:hypothetical protein